MIRDFICPFCGNQFSLPEEKIDPAGSRGKCKGCLNNLMVFRDGKAVPVKQPEAAAAGPPPRVPQAPAMAGVKEKDPPIWNVRLKATGAVLPGCPITLAEVLWFILEDKLTPDDEAQIEGGGQWLPLSGYPAMDPLFAEKVKKNREKFGDEDHCVNHQAVESRWYCGKCRKYYCQKCALNKPFVPGGADHFVCPEDDMELFPTKKKASGLAGLFGLKSKK